MSDKKPELQFSIPWLISGTARGWFAQTIFCIIALAAIAAFTFMITERIRSIEPSEPHIDFSVSIRE
ncbi:MAG: hypothetical protein AAF619_05800 [Pseudomonadota bacterium]